MRQLWQGLPFLPQIWHIRHMKLVCPSRFSFQSVQKTKAMTKIAVAIINPAIPISILL
jgi:hypothetical protein